MQQPILICGAGPTGLMMALCLTRLGITCRIIDKLTAATTQSRALGIHARSLEIFDSLELIDDFIEQGLMVDKIAMFADKKQLAQLNYGMIESLFPYLLMLPQSATEAILAKHLSQAGVEVERGVELIDFNHHGDDVVVTLKTPQGSEKVETPYLIGCDGAHSRVRKGLNLNFAGSSVQEQWILADVVASHQREEMAQQLVVFQDSHGVLVIFPLGDNHYRLVSQRHANVDKNKEVTLGEFETMIDAMIPWQFTIEESSWISAFTINYRRSNEIMKKRVFLCGDAAHIHSPVGGQGMNTGMQDAYNLAWKIAFVLKHEFKSELFESFAIERSAVAHDVLKETEMATKIATLRNPILRWFRNKFVNWVSSNKRIQSLWAQNVSEIGIRYPKTQLSRDLIKPSRLPVVAVGKRMPDLVVADDKQNSFHLHWLQRQYKFTCFLFITQSELLSGQMLSIQSLVHDSADWMQWALITAENHNILAIENTRVLHGGNKARDKLGIYTNSCIITRPDGVVSYRSDEIDMQSISNYFHSLRR